MLLVYLLIILSFGIWKDYLIWFGDLYFIKIFIINVLILMGVNVYLFIDLL